MSRQARGMLLGFGAAALLAAAAPAPGGGGPPTCPWDCGDPSNGVVGTSDFLALLSQWGVQGSACDFGLGPPGVGTGDFLALLQHWGPCPAPPSGACCLANGTCVLHTSADCTTAAGFYNGDGSTCQAADCFPCPDPATTPENEPNCGLPVDTVNGGCTLATPVYSTIACGQSRCGTAASTVSARDTDWYRLVFTGARKITWTVTVEFPAVIGIAQYIAGQEGGGNCNQLTGFLSPSANVATGQTGTVTSQCLPAGTYFLYVAPQIGQVVTCGAEYLAVVTCQTGCAGACCFSNGVCANNGTQGQCAFLGGFFQGEGSACATGLCPVNCGNPAAGSCCTPHAAPGCADHNCCQAVCTLDPFCCSTAWDSVCVSHTANFPSQCGCGG